MILLPGENFKFGTMAKFQSLYFVDPDSPYLFQVKKSAPIGNVWYMYARSLLAPGMVEFQFM